MFLKGVALWIRGSDRSGASQTTNSYKMIVLADLDRLNRPIEGDTSGPTLPTTMPHCMGRKYMDTRRSIARALHMRFRFHRGNSCPAGDGGVVVWRPLV